MNNGKCISKYSFFLVWKFYVTTCREGLKLKIEAYWRGSIRARGRGVLSRKPFFFKEEHRIIINYTLNMIGFILAH